MPFTPSTPRTVVGLVAEWQRRDREGHSEDAIYGACADELIAALDYTASELEIALAIALSDVLPRREKHRTLTSTLLPDTHIDRLVAALEARRPGLIDRFRSP